MSSFSHSLRSLSRIAATLLATAASAPGTALAQPPARGAVFVVVVNASNPLEEIDRDALSKLFLKRDTKWPSGKAAQPLDLTLAAPAREAFSRQVLNKSVAAVRSFWQQQIFSGRDVPPPEKGSDADVIAAVRASADAVGYVSADAQLPSGVKVLSIRGKP